MPLTLQNGSESNDMPNDTLQKGSYNNNIPLAIKNGSKTNNMPNKLQNGSETNNIPHKLQNGSEPNSIHNESNRDKISLAVIQSDLNLNIQGSLTRTSPNLPNELDSSSNVSTPRSVRECINKILQEEALKSAVYFIFSGYISKKNYLDFHFKIVL